jgi:2-polyprenyl-3-methyl-5-hydroxy-6-metoxy-1,4-benzoquinol methylase
MERKTHWEDVYRTKAPTEVSWFQEHPGISLELIQRTGVDKESAHIIDVGGGASRLVDELVDRGFRHISVLDISAAALAVAQQRLASASAEIAWLEADITQAALPSGWYDVWHDRAVFHFLTQREDRQRYVDAIQHSVKPGGHIIIATFGPDGPTRCSGLEVVRYDPESLQREFGEGVELVESVYESHQTPFGTEQKFIYCYFRKR